MRFAAAIGALTLLPVCIEPSPAPASQPTALVGAHQVSVMSVRPETQDGADIQIVTVKASNGAVVQVHMPAVAPFFTTGQEALLMDYADGGMHLTPGLSIERKSKIVLDKAAK